MSSCSDQALIKWNLLIHVEHVVKASQIILCKQVLDKQIERFYDPGTILVDFPPTEHHDDSEKYSHPQLGSRTHERERGFELILFFVRI